MHKALVFGGSGFIGSHLIDLLLEEGYEVLNIDTVSNKWLDRTKNNIYEEQYYKVSANNYPHIYAEITYFKPNIVFNFLATADITSCDNEPAKSFLNNAGTNAVIVNALKGIKNCLYVFASSVYAGCDDSGIYGVSKRASEEFIKSYFKTDKRNKYLILRYGTVYGPRATQENGIRRLVISALSDKVITHYGTGEESREYIHVRDCARNTLTLCKDLKCRNKTVKITGASSIKSKQVVLLLKEILGDGYSVEFNNENIVGHYLNTPYRYVRNEVINYVSNEFIDLGAGLLEVVKEINNDRQ